MVGGREMRMGVVASSPGHDGRAYREEIIWRAKRRVLAATLRREKAPALARPRIGLGIISREAKA